MTILEIFITILTIIIMIGAYWIIYRIPLYFQRLLLKLYEIQHYQKIHGLETRRQDKNKKSREK